MVYVFATIRAQAAHADTLAAALLQLAVASRAEPGCRGYRVFRGAHDPARFTTFEHWADADAGAAHMASAHIAAAFAMAGPLLSAAPEICKFNEL